MFNEQDGKRVRPQFGKRGLATHEQPERGRPIAARLAGLVRRLLGKGRSPADKTKKKKGLKSSCVKAVAR